VDWQIYARSEWVPITCHAPAHARMKKKILVLERDRDILEILTYILIERGYQVVSTQNEEEIFGHIATLSPDAILLDIINPSFEGTKLCRAIKAAETTKHIPVIVLSTNCTVETIKEACADDILAKPFDISELIDALEKQLIA
jgi:DNA-binding response OmpR family regulator